MIQEKTEWKKNKELQIQTATIEFRASDFYGPFVEAQIQKNGQVKIWPKKLKIETPEVSTSDLEILAKMADECYAEYGEFVLILPLFKINITGKKPAKELITEELMKIRLF